MSDKVVEEKNLLLFSIDFIENSNKGAVFDYIRQSIKLFIFHSLDTTAPPQIDETYFYPSAIVNSLYKYLTSETATASSDKWICTP